MDNYKKDMLLIDFEVRRNDVLQRLQRIEEDMRYGAIITGGLWAWIIPKLDDELVSTYLVWMPTVFVLFMCLKYIAQDGAVKFSGKYIRHLEDVFGLHSLKGCCGWESYLKANEANHFIHRKLLRYHSVLFWLSLLVINIFGGIYFKSFLEN